MASTTKARDHVWAYPEERLRPRPLGSKTAAHHVKLLDTLYHTTLTTSLPNVIHVLVLRKRTRRANVQQRGATHKNYDLQRYVAKREKATSVFGNLWVSLTELSS